MDMRTTVAREWIQDLELFVVEDRAHEKRHGMGMRAGVTGSEANVDARNRDRANSVPAFEVGRLGSEDGRGRSSPFRLASYDLLKLLATRTAMECVLAEENGVFGCGESSSSNRRWLLRFWEGRCGTFRGHSIWSQGDDGMGVADSFVKALFDAEPSIVRRTRSGEGDLVDPGGLAETVLAVRAGIAKEWVEALGLVEEEHRCWKQWKSDLL